MTDESKLLRVPSEALRAVVTSVREGLSEKQRLQDELARAVDEAKELELKLAKRQVQLERCMAFRSDVASPGLRGRPPSRTTSSMRRQRNNKSLPNRNRSHSDHFSSGIRDRIDEQTQELARLAAREDNVRADPLC